MLFPSEPLDLYHIETAHRQAGNHHIIGIDEAGRGPLAGPVVAAAVSLPDAITVEGLNDSKKLNSSQRDRLYNYIMNRTDIAVAISAVSHTEIDRINILRATYLAMKDAALKISGPVDIILVDGLPVPGLPYPSCNIVKGDQRCACIAAAGIIAKVHRDRLMADFDNQFPEYGFRRHKGYATKDHLAALANFGPCPIHRRSFAPVAAVSEQAPVNSLPLWSNPT